MKLFLKNIGKIAETTVEIKGISVIAGENNTGKSTVGKALFSVFNSFYKIQEQILHQTSFFQLDRWFLLARQVRSVEEFINRM